MCRSGMWRFAPCKPCPTMPAYPVPAFLQTNCVCVRMLPRREIKEVDSPSCVNASSCARQSDTKPDSRRSQTLFSRGGDNTGTILA